MKLGSQLVIKQSQKLTMTQGLQQAIRILQLNQQDLQLEIDNFLDSNIMLERDSDTVVSSDEQEVPAGDAENMPEKELDFEETISVDADWEYENSDGTTNYSLSDVDADPLNQLSEAHIKTIEEDLLWQLELNTFSDVDFLIGKIIISEINDEGFLLTPLEEIVELVEPFYPEIDLKEVEVVLKRIQRFEPTGIAARSLEESLINQINAMDPKPLWAKKAILILMKGVDDLTRLNLIGLQNLLKVDEGELRSILNELRRLNPKPGYKVGRDDVAGIKPEIIVTVNNNKITVALNEEIVPKLRINREYEKLAQLKRHKDSEVLRSHLSEAQNLIRSVHSRFDTLLIVAKEVVEHQSAFFFEGKSAIRPLQLKSIAEKLELNESTISRAVSGKYLLAPTGTHELKFFFSNQVGSLAEDGQEDISGVAIRAALQEIIKQENPEKPYSDAKLVALLEEKGFNIARRTVSKYRDVLGIASSSNRRRLA